MLPDLYIEAAPYIALSFGLGVAMLCATICAGVAAGRAAWRIVQGVHGLVWWCGNRQVRLDGSSCRRWSGIGDRPKVRPAKPVTSAGEA